MVSLRYKHVQFIILMLQIQAQGLDDSNLGTKMVFEQQRLQAHCLV